MKTIFVSFGEFFRYMRGAQVKKFMNDKAQIEKSIRLNSRENRLNHEDISYRMLSHWEKAGVLNFERAERGWRKYSVMDILWLQIVNELRKFNFPLETIKFSKEFLEFASRDLVKDNKYSIYPVLEFYYYLTLLRVPVVVIVTNLGEIYPMSFVEYQEFYKILNENHVCINLNRLIDSIKINGGVKLRKENFNDFKQELNRLLEENDWKSITIHNKGKIRLIEKTSVHSPNKVLDQIKKEAQFQRITIDLENGKTVHVSNTIKTRLND